jgi:hypothetical protein
MPVGTMLNDRSDALVPGLTSTASSYRDAATRGAEQPALHPPLRAFEHMPCAARTRSARTKSARRLLGSPARRRTAWGRACADRETAESEKSTAGGTYGACLQVMASATDALRFPDGFLWGAATSAHQTEGPFLNSDWWVSSKLDWCHLRATRATRGRLAETSSVRPRSERVPHVDRVSASGRGRFDETAVAHCREHWRTARGWPGPIVTLPLHQSRWLSEGGG